MQKCETPKNESFSQGRGYEKLFRRSEKNF